MRILVVDDDVKQAQSLARLIARRAGNVHVETAHGGGEAVEHLRSSRTDLVLTDLQMPGTSGIDLVEWIMAHQPHVTVFAMTAYPDDAALRQLEDFGTVECFIKPIDVAALTGRLVAALSDGLRGQLRNISLPSLLQLVDMERKTCTFVLGRSGEVGRLYFRGGELIDARLGGLQGDDAATEMVSWSSPHVTIISTCATKQRTVTRPLGFIIMEAMRVLDERGRSVPTDTPVLLAGGESLPPAERVSIRPLPSLSQFPTPPTSQARTVAIIERESGKVLTSSGGNAEFSDLARLLAEVFSAEDALAKRLGEGDAIEEMVLTGSSFWAVCRPLEVPGRTLAISVFDPKEATIAMERFELKGLAVALREWSRRPVQT
jgi:CheY-like chemotaxis protein